MPPVNVPRLLGAAAWSALHAPRKRAEMAIRGSAPPLERGRALKLLSWNIQFSAGRSVQFFYDGGPGSHVQIGELRKTTEAIRDVIEGHDVDFVQLQEVDRNSERTHYIDQHAIYGEGWPVTSSAPYFRCPYVPVPPHQPLGAVEMHLSTLSRWRIQSAVRWPLPKLREAWIRRQFNLRRALVEQDLPLAGGGVFKLFHTHLSAFSFGDGTMKRQVAFVMRRLQAATNAGIPWVMTGDFNSLPPDDDPARLGEASALYDSKSAVEPLFRAGYATRPSTDVPEHRSWIEHGAARPDRTLDYVFAGPGVHVESVEVLDEPMLSDHLPLLCRFRIPAKHP